MFCKTLIGQMKYTSCLARGRHVYPRQPEMQAQLVDAIRFSPFEMLCVYYNDGRSCCGVQHFALGRRKWQQLLRQASQLTRDAYPHIVVPRNPGSYRASDGRGGCDGGRYSMEVFPIEFDRMLFGAPRSL